MRRCTTGQAVCPTPGRAAPVARGVPLCDIPIIWRAHPLRDDGAGRQANVDRSNPHSHAPESMRTHSSEAPSRGRLPLVLALGLGLAACGDGQPVAPGQPPAIAPSGLQAFDCTGTTAGALTCRPATAGTGAALGSVIGGQNVYLKLTSSNVSYDAGTEIFQMDVTVQNLMNEAIGTPDGVTPDPAGVKVFFYVEPAVSDGEGSIEVMADGTEFFTSADQPYYMYPVMLAKDAVSPARTWQFSLPPTVTEFTFQVLVKAEVQPLLVINEILANPGGTISDANGEWIEIYNAGTRAVELQGLVIADSAASGRRPFHLIASSFVIEPGGYGVIGNNANTTDNGGVPVDYVYGNAMAFANSLDAFKISRVFGSDTLTLDRIQYASAAISAQNGISRELRNPALDNSNVDGSNWADASVTAVYGPGGRGTPGAQNSTYTP